MLGVHTAGSWLVLGVFSAEPRQVLGGISASSRRNLGKFSAESRQVLGGTSASSRRKHGKPSADLKASKGCRKDSLREAKRLPEGCRKAPRMPKRRRKGCQKGSKGTPKPQKNESVFRNRFRMPPRVPTRTLCPSFWLHFGFILGAKIVNFSSHFLPSFLDAFLEAFGCICGVILDGCWRSFLVLFRTL